MRLLLCLLGCATYTFAQPLIYNRGVVNVASYMPSTLPGGSIAQGAMFSIFGARLGPGSPQQVSSYPLDIALAGTTITITKGSTTVNAIPAYVSAGQINAIMPSNAPLGQASVRVRTATGTSNAMTVNIAKTAFGIFTSLGIGSGPASLQNYVSPAEQPLNSPLLTATPGQLATLWGVGLGPVSSDVTAPVPGTLPGPLEILVGGVPVTNIAYAGRTPCCVGIDQIVFNIPANAPRGCWVPIVVRTGTVVSNVTTVAISDHAGTSCLSNTPVYPLVTAGRHAAFLSMRVSTREDVGVRSPMDVVGDYGIAVSYQLPNSQFPFHPIFSYPPEGTCTVYANKGDVLRGDTLPGAVPAGAKPLSFGAGFSVTGPNGTRVIQNLLSADPVSFFGGSITGNLFNNSLFLDPGPYRINGVGGLDVGPFSGSGTMPNPITWNNRDQITSVDRAQPLNLNWSGGSGAQVAIVGAGVDLPSDSSTIFACIAPAGANSFTVPNWVLSNLPPTRPNPLQSKDVIYLINVPDKNTGISMSASGLDSAVAFFQSATGKTVRYR